MTSELMLIPGTFLITLAVYALVLHYLLEHYSDAHPADPWRAAGLGALAIMGTSALTRVIVDLALPDSGIASLVGFGATFTVTVITYVRLFEASVGKTLALIVFGAVLASVLALLVTIVSALLIVPVSLAAGPAAGALTQAALGGLMVFGVYRHATAGRRFAALAAE